MKITNFDYRVWLISCILSIAISVSPASADTRYNITFAQLDTCDRYDITDAGYSYKDFFMVHIMDNNNIKPNERLHLKFYVFAAMDAHILLSVTDQPRAHDRVYEIVIGAGGNTFSTIRSPMGLRRIATNQDPKLLSMFDPTPIEIIQTKDGELQVFIPGHKTEPLMRYLDVSPLTINYISFSSYGTNSARWFYDCAFDGYSNEMEMEKRELSAEQRLLDVFQQQSQNRSMPANLSDVSFGFQMLSLAYEQSSALLRTRMQLLLHWQDARLSWLPKDYANVTVLEHPQLQELIWTPPLVVLNGALDSLVGALKSYELRVYANGNVTLLASNLELTTWCVDAARNWPDERIDCDIELGIEATIGISLIYDQAQPWGSNDHINTLSAWTFVRIGVAQVENATQMRYTDSGVLQTMSGDVAIEFTMRRNSTFYRHVFVVPLIACQIFIVLSFVLRGYRRGALILIVLLLTTFGLMYMTKHATPHYVPPLMLAYQHIMEVATVCYLLHIAIMWLECYPPRAKLPGCLNWLINVAPLRLVLCLRFADAEEYCDIEVRPWRQLAKLCNNFTFIAVTAYFMIMDVLQLGGI